MTRANYSGKLTALKDRQKPESSWNLASPNQLTKIQSPSVVPSGLLTRSQPTRSLIILLAGVPGVGKTTLGNALLGELGLTHHISTGFLRAAIDLYLPPEQSSLLRRHAFDAYELLDPSTLSKEDYVLQGAIAQTEILKPVIGTCVARARREGIGLVMEGSHFIPGVIDPAEIGADLLCVLDVPNREELKARALSPNHVNRHLSSWDQERLVILQDRLLAMAHAQNRPVIININLPDAVQAVKELAKECIGTPSL